MNWLGSFAERSAQGIDMPWYAFRARCRAFARPRSCFLRFVASQKTTPLRTSNRLPPPLALRLQHGSWARPQLRARLSRRAPLSAFAKTIGVGRLEAVSNRGDPSGAPLLDILGTDNARGTGCLTAPVLPASWPAGALFAHLCMVRQRRPYGLARPPATAGGL